MTTKTERFELRLRPNIPAEAKLLTELDALDGVYGGKTELLRECLRRGFTSLNAAVEAQLPEATEEEVLGHLASVFPSGEYSYRIGKLFLDARDTLRAEKELDEPGSKVNATVQPLQAQESSASVEVASSVQAGEGATSTPQESLAEGQATGDVAGEAKPAVNWKRFRGLAGSGDVKPES